MKKVVFTLIMLNAFCSWSVADYSGTPVTMKSVYKDDSEDGDYATSRVHVRIKTTLTYDGMTPYILESIAYSKVTMEANEQIIFTFHTSHLTSPALTPSPRRYASNDTRSAGATLPRLTSGPYRSISWRRR